MKTDFSDWYLDSRKFVSRGCLESILNFAVVYVLSLFWDIKSFSDLLSWVKSFVTRYSKRYLTALATSYWFSYKYYSVISVQQSFQVKRFNMIGCKLWPNPRYVQIKGQWLKAQYCSEWTELWYGTLVRFLCSEMTMMTKPELCKFIILFKYLLLIDL